jgi:hypothetical protein
MTERVGLKLSRSGPKIQRASLLPNKTHIDRIDSGREPVRLVDNAGNHLEPARASNSGKINSEADGQNSIRIDRTESAHFIQID